MSLHGQSYGHAYLKSYGWSGTGTGLRNGSIDKPLAIPPKKNLAGVGKDRDEAFPFWDHGAFGSLFTAASKAITIRVSGDDDDEDPPNSTLILSLQRTTTGIISNRAPVSGTPASASASASGTATPESDIPGASGVLGRLSLVATAKREAAKRGLYSKFFRGPVIGPDVMPLSVSTPATERVDGTVKITEQARESKKRKSEDGAETREERRERKRLKRERKAARAARKAQKAEKKKAAVETDKSAEGLQDDDRKVPKQDKETKLAGGEGQGISLSSKKKKRKRGQDSAEVVEGGSLVTKMMGKKSNKHADVADEMHKETSPRPNTTLPTKKKKGKRKEASS
ncbi:hypothetical protein BU15DRAFT_72638 [Melanogaster broomeanus]|nr:hypothetical protein BU15DRAFT_72638 [Melanogaster broomeanus]